MGFLGPGSWRSVVENREQKGTTHGPLQGLMFGSCCLNTALSLLAAIVLNLFLEIIKRASTRRLCLGSSGYPLVPGSRQLNEERREERRQDLVSEDLDNKQLSEHHWTLKVSLCHPEICQQVHLVIWRGIHLQQFDGSLRLLNIQYTYLCLKLLFWRQRNI